MTALSHNAGMMFRSNLKDDIESTLVIFKGGGFELISWFMSFVTLRFRGKRSWRVGQYTVRELHFNPLDHISARHRPAQLSRA